MVRLNTNRITREVMTPNHEIPCVWLIRIILRDAEYIGCTYVFIEVHLVAMICGVVVQLFCIVAVPHRRQCSWIPPKPGCVAPNSSANTVS